MDSPERMAASPRERSALAATRIALIVALLGTFLLPTVANVAAAVALLSLAGVPHARARLLAALGQPLGTAAIGLLAVFALATAWSDAGWRIALGSLWSWRTMLLLVVSLAVFDERVWKTRLALVFVLVGGLGVIWAYASWLGYLPSKDAQVPGVVLRDAATQAMTFAIVVYLGLALLLTERQLPRLVQWAVAAAVLLCFANLIALATGRSGIVVLLTTLGMTVLLQLRGWRRVAALLAIPLLAAAAYGASPVIQHRFAQGWSEMLGYEQQTEVTSMGIRVVIWRTTAELIAERPLLGYGMGGFPPAYAQRALRNGPGWQSTPTSDPHNQYLFIEAEAGVLGLLAFAWFLIAATRQPVPMPYRAVGLSLLAAWCMTSLFSSHFRNFNEGHMIALLLGAFLARERDTA
jgi:O-antigen ligase